MGIWEVEGSRCCGDLIGIRWRIHQRSGDLEQEGDMMEDCVDYFGRGDVV